MNYSSRLLFRSGIEAKQPILSIAIPTYQRYGMLCEALESVFSLNFAIPIEIIVVDNDPSNDSCAFHYMKQFSNKPFSYYKNCENLGMFNNWNQCLNLAAGKYITILHDDDLFSSAFADEVNEMMAKKDGLPDIFGYRCALLDQRSNKPYVAVPFVKNCVKKFVKKLVLKKNRCTKKSVVDFFLRNQFCGTLGVVMNRDMAISLGGFDSSWHPVADYEFWCRWVSFIGDITILDQKIGFYRMRENESMRPEVQDAFISKSLLLRSKLISQGVVPKYFRVLLVYLKNVQRQSIARDWRIATEKSIPPLVICNIIFLRLVSFILPLFVSSKIVEKFRGNI